MNFSIKELWRKYFTREVRILLFTSGFAVLFIYSICIEEKLSLILSLIAAILVFSIILLTFISFLLPKTLKDKTENILRILFLTVLCILFYSLVIWGIRNIVHFLLHLKVSYEG